MVQHFNSILRGGYKFFIGRASLKPPGSLHHILHAKDVSRSLQIRFSFFKFLCYVFLMMKLYTNLLPCFSDECKNFLERLGYEDMEKLKDDGKEEELRNWASFRGQTLNRTGNKILTIGYWWKTRRSNFYPYIFCGYSKRNDVL